MKKQILAVTFATVLAFAATAQAAPTAPLAPTPTAAAATEKCYGVAKAGKEVAVEVPAGVCEKLANGTLTAPAAEAPKAEAPAKK